MKTIISAILILLVPFSAVAQRSERASANTARAVAQAPKAPDFDVQGCLLAKPILDPQLRSTYLTAIRNRVVQAMQKKHESLAGSGSSLYNACRAEFGSTGEADLKLLRQQLAILARTTTFNKRQNPIKVLESPLTVDSSFSKLNRRIVSGFPWQHPPTDSEKKEAEKSIKELVEKCGFSRTQQEFKTAIAKAQSDFRNDKTAESRTLSNDANPSRANQHSNLKTDECGRPPSDGSHQIDADANLAIKDLIPRLELLVRRAHEKQQELAQKKAEELISKNPLLGFFKTADPDRTEFVRACREYSESIQTQKKELEAIADFSNEKAGQIALFGPAVLQVLQDKQLQSQHLDINWCSVHNGVIKTLASAAEFRQFAKIGASVANFGTCTPAVLFTTFGVPCLVTSAGAAFVSGVDAYQSYSNRKMQLSGAMTGQNRSLEGETLGAKINQSTEAVVNSSVEAGLNSLAAVPGLVRLGTSARQATIETGPFSSLIKKGYSNADVAALQATSPDVAQRLYKTLDAQKFDRGELEILRKKGFQKLRAGDACK